MNPSRSFSTAKHVCTVFLSIFWYCIYFGQVWYCETDKADMYMYRDLWRCLPSLDFIPRLYIIVYSTNFSALSISKYTTVFSRY